MNEQELLQPQTEKLRVFISSRMQELEDLRAYLSRELKVRGIDAFVYELDLGARPDDPETVSLLEVEKTDVFVLVIGRTYGEITEREYERARELNKPCLVYERLGRTTTDEKLQGFMNKLSGARKVPSRSTFRMRSTLLRRSRQMFRAGWSESTGVSRRSARRRLSPHGVRGRSTTVSKGYSPAQRRLYQVVIHLTC